MNVRLEHQFQFSAAACLDGSFHINNYYIKLSMLTLTFDGVEQNVALDRMRYMLFKHFQNCVFVHESDSESIDKFQNADLNVVILPETPVDQIIGIMLYCKLNAVMQDRLVITELKISSDLGENLWYLQDQEEDVDPFREIGWWHTPDPNTFEKNKNYSNIIRLQKSLSWHEFDLEWDDELFQEQEQNTILIFDKNDKE